jgi:hypothetical protein
VRVRARVPHKSRGSQPRRLVGTTIRQAHSQRGHNRFSSVGECRPCVAPSSVEGDGFVLPAPGCMRRARELAVKAHLRRRDPPGAGDELNRNDRWSRCLSAAAPSWTTARSGRRPSRSAVPMRRARSLIPFADHSRKPAHLTQSWPYPVATSVRSEPFSALRLALHLHLSLTFAEN